MVMVRIIEYLVVLIHLFLIFKVTFKKNSYLFSLIHVVFYVFEIFFVVPMLLNLVLGEMQINSIGYMYINNNKQVDLIYALFTLLEGYILFKQIKKYNKKKKISEFDSFKSIGTFVDKFSLNIVVGYILFIGATLPLIVAIFAPEPSLYFTKFAAFHRSGIFISSEAKEFHNSVMSNMVKISFISISCLWLLCKNNRKLVKIYLSIMIAILILFSSKRTLGLITIAVVTAIEILYYKKKNYIRTIILSVVIMGGYFIFYQSIVQKTVGGGISDAYEMYIIYFSRILDMKLVIYSILNPDIVSILDYQGQSYLFNILFFIPRAVWINKPYPYGVYYTAAWTGQNVTNVTYRYTVSCFSEAVANFGFVGILIITWIYLKVIKYVENRDNPIIKIFGYYVVVYLMITHFQSNINNIIIFLCMEMLFKLQKKCLKKDLKKIKVEILS